MAKFGEIEVGARFKWRGNTATKVKPVIICTFQPYNANEGTARYAEGNAIIEKPGRGFMYLSQKKLKKSLDPKGLVPIFLISENERETMMRDYKGDIIEVGSIVAYNAGGKVRKGVVIEIKPTKKYPRRVYVKANPGDWVACIKDAKIGCCVFHKPA